MGAIRRSGFVVLTLALVALATVPAQAARHANAARRAHTGKAATPYDWSTFGFSLDRIGYNDLEQTLGTGNASTLHQVWTVDLGAVTISQPVYAAGVNVNGSTRDLVYTGSEHGGFFAIDASTGEVVWQRDLGSATTNCFNTPDAVFGVSGTATFDRATNRVYAVGGNGFAYALDMSTGDVQPGWPVKVIGQPTLNHVWGALALSAGKLYVPTGGMCDIPPYHGHLAEIDTTTANQVANWIVNTSYSGPSGGAIWGYGGVSIKPETGSVFAATGNAVGASTEHYAYSEHVVQLSSSLVVQASNYPGVTGTDVDFGSTPALYTPTGCKAKLAVMNKTGQLFQYNRGSIGSGPVQTLQISARGVFIGVTAYSPATRMLYVPNPNDSASGVYHHGLVALKVGSNCLLTLAWQATVGMNKSSVASPMIANGVVYYGDGQGARAFAFNAASGQQLWSSGSAISGSVYAAPTLADGKLFVGAWDHLLHAFAP